MTYYNTKLPLGRKNIAVLLGLAKETDQTPHRMIKNYIQYVVKFNPKGVKILDSSIVIESRNEVQHKQIQQNLYRITPYIEKVLSTANANGKFKKEVNS